MCYEHVPTLRLVKIVSYIESSWVLVKDKIGNGFVYRIAKNEIKLHSLSLYIYKLLPYQIAPRVLSRI